SLAPRAPTHQGDPGRPGSPFFHPRAAVRPITSSTPNLSLSSFSFSFSPSVPHRIGTGEREREREKRMIRPISPATPPTPPPPPATMRIPALLLASAALLSAGPVNSPPMIGINLSGA